MLYQTMEVISNMNAIPIVLLFALSAPAMCAQAEPALNTNATAIKAPIIWENGKPPTYAFQAFDKAFTLDTGSLHLKTKNAQGGAGILTSLDLSAYLNWTPCMTLTLNEANKGTVITLYLGNKEASHKYHFRLKDLKPGHATTVIAESGASLAEPVEPLAPDKRKLFDPAAIKVIQFMGDWSNRPYDLSISKISMVPPNDDIMAQRAVADKKRAEAEAQAAREAEEKARLIKELLTNGSKHPADGPEVAQVCAVASDVIAVAIQAGKPGNKQLTPYVAEANDEIEQDKGKPIHEIKDGKLVESYPKTLFRKDKGKRIKIAPITQDGKWLITGEATAGTMLDERIADSPAAFSIQSNDDAAYSKPQPPAAVFRKAKPNSYTRPLAMRHTISLKLPTTLKQGATYTIRFIGINTATESITYTHDPKHSPSQAIHAIQTGYRPDDPYKRAYLSFWMGLDASEKSASAAMPPDRFDLIDQSGKSVFSGKPESRKNAGDKEQITVHPNESLDYSMADVLSMDFSTFKTPGEYRVFVPGIGTSTPFRIASDVWKQPFLAAMHGILIQRSGMALSPPFTTFNRPRPFHPDDGVEFYQMTIPLSGGQEGERGKNLMDLAAAGKLERVTGVSGGYQDAGDWDSLAGHLSTTCDLLALFDLNPEAFAKTKLVLPAAEMNNKLPDILDEALWQMPLFKSLQLPHGGVRGGYGYGWGCPPHTTSDMIKSVGVYDVCLYSSYRYAAAAAKSARVLEPYDQPLAAQYLESAKRAWSWAEANMNENSTAYQKARLSDKDFPRNMDDRRAEAALELLTATRNPEYDKAFKSSSELTKSPNATLISQAQLDFSYARLPDGLGDPELKKLAVTAIRSAADYAIQQSRKNAFDIIAGKRADVPLIFVGKYFSTPGAGGLLPIYAYELTKEPSYLAAVIQGSNYCLGANQDNLSYCSGIGGNAQRNAFRVDALINGQADDQEAMKGHIPYGQGSEGSSMSMPMNSWVQQWILNFGKDKKMAPNWYQWPVYEQYIDFAIYPLHNENCFNDTTVPAACYWFYLNHRK